MTHAPLFQNKIGTSEKADEKKKPKNVITKPSSRFYESKAPIIHAQSTYTVFQIRVHRLADENTLCRHSD